MAAGSESGRTARIPKPSASRSVKSGRIHYQVDKAMKAGLIIATGRDEFCSKTLLVNTRSPF
jgi:hypothetical protein